MTAGGRAELWGRLAQAGLVWGPLPPETGKAGPWYLRVMLGVAGWAGALFLLAFVATGFAFVMESAAVAAGGGAALCAAAALLLRSGEAGDFRRQFALALSLTGQLLVLWGLVDALPDAGRMVAGMVMLVAAVLFGVIPDFIHRAWSAAAAAAALG